MAKSLSLILAPNEDGYGTSAWVVRLARELTRYPEIAHVKVVVASKKLEDFHRDKYPTSARVEVVTLEGNPNGLVVAKTGGAVDVPKTIQHCLHTYLHSRSAYAAALQQGNILADAGLVIDFGVPQLVRATYEEQGISQRTFFDHAWSLTLNRMVEGHLAVSPGNPGRAEREAVEHSLEAIRNDEALTGSVFLFDEPICPSGFHSYWHSILGQAPLSIPGVLGGPLSALEFANDPDIHSFRAHLEQTGHCSPEVYTRASRYAKMLLGITNTEPILFITGGGTPVWDEVLADLLDEYFTYAPAYNVVIHSPAEAARRRIPLKAVSVELNGLERTIERAILKPSGRTSGTVIIIDRLAEETHQVLFAAFDLILTRAGGGTVSNAIAFKVPLVLVEEPGMWQVEQVRQACLRLGIGEAINLADFQARRRKCVEMDSGELKSQPIQQANMRAIPNHGEIFICPALLKSPFKNQ